MRSFPWFRSRRAPAAPPPAAAAGEAPSASAAEAKPAAAPPALDVNVMLHAARSAHLGAMPQGAKRLLSAGCSGLWYFEWIEKRYGHVPEHIGVEYYMPRPDGLPANVRWIANSVSEMTEVADRSCDLVFSGQNIEHLWPEETAGFLAESARVLRPGGHLVVDSPNRIVTAALNWSHPEHTIELSLPEITRLLRLAGCEPTKAAGIWLCRDPQSGRFLPFDPNIAEPDWHFAERLVAAEERPEQSFIWWVEARRGAAPPDKEAIASMLAELFRAHWPERTERFAVPAARTREQRTDGEWVRAAAGEPGPVFFGPNMPLRAGRYRVTFRLDPEPAGERPDAGEPYALCDVLSAGSEEKLASIMVGSGVRSASLAFSLPAVTFGLQFRCISLGRTGFAVRRAVTIEE